MKKSAVIFQGVLYEVQNTLCGDRAHPFAHLSVTKNHRLNPSLIIN